MAAIEDIDYLLENSEQQSHLVHIDSAARDRTLYPRPNEFVVDFPTPFRFVYGYDILDAVVPTTMYNIEPHNNTMVFGRVESMRPGWSSEMGALDAAFFSEFAFIPDVGARFTDPTPGAVTIVEAATLSMLGIVSALDDNGPGVWVIHRVQAASAPDDTYSVRVLHPALYLTDADAGLLTSKHHVKTGATDDAGLTEVHIARFVHLADFDYTHIVQSQSFDVRILVHNIHLAPRQYDSRQLQQALNALMVDTGCTIAHVSAVPEQANRYLWTSDAPFWFNMSATTCRRVIGFDELNTPPGIPDHYRTFPNNMDPERRMFASVFDTVAHRHTLVSPGLIDLAGIPYVVLRAPELEDHAYSGESHNQVTVRGLGIFKLLASGGGLTNLRFDFVNFSRRPWHPIGKLSRLTFRIERSNGELYDFKSINWSILMVFKYFVPAVRAKQPRYNIGMLNAEYKPDAQSFYMKQRRLLDASTSSDSGSDEEEDNRSMVQSLVDRLRQRSRQTSTTMPA
jgi:hypothetical protein